MFTQTCCFCSALVDGRRRKQSTETSGIVPANIHIVRILYLIYQRPSLGAWSQAANLPLFIRESERTVMSQNSTPPTQKPTASPPGNPISPRSSQSVPSGTVFSAQPIESSDEERRVETGSDVFLAAVRLSIRFPSKGQVGSFWAGFISGSFSWAAQINDGRLELFDCCCGDFEFWFEETQAKKCHHILSAPVGRRSVTLCWRILCLPIRLWGLWTIGFDCFDERFWFCVFSDWLRVSQVCIDLDRLSMCCCLWVHATIQRFELLLFKYVKSIL